jgi:metallo-beta-lactamase family protein
MENRATITFYGGAGSVTGANFLLDTGDSSTKLGAGKKILIDCGALEREAPSHGSALGYSKAGEPAKNISAAAPKGPHLDFLGRNTVEKISAHVCDDANAMPFKYDPASIDVLIVTHAHADHIGRIPKLVRDGFKGMIVSTGATKDLAALMFDDAINVMRNDAEKHGCTVLYEKEDAQMALSLWNTHDYHESFTIGTAHVELLDAGHILGSAMVKFTRNDRVIIFTGDLGNSPEPLLNDTESPEGANYILMESVYGDRVHEGRDERDEVLESTIEATRQRKGTLLIPSFSIERTQILLFEIDKMIEKGMKPIDVYLDAPLAIRVTDVYRKYSALLNPDARAHFEGGKDPFTFKNLHVIKDVHESAKIHDAPDPKIIIAGAGMSVGGRIRAHETRYLPDPNASVLFVGYQAPGSLGRRIEEGQKNIRIDGAQVRVQASIGSLTGYSGHKDRDGLLDFVEYAGPSLQKVFVAMGEPKSELFLAQRIRDYLGVEAEAPEAGTTEAIDW